MPKVKKIPQRQCVGCREMKDKKSLLRVVRSPEGEISLEEAVYILKRDTRHFAKRQITWFKREKDVIWVNKPDFHYNDEEICAFMREILQEKGIVTTC